MDEQKQPQREMPKYKCTKIVSALKIKGIDIPGSVGAFISPEEEGFATFQTSLEWRERFKGSESDLGYYVVYEDGYTSWSPTKAFEEGYVRI